MRWPLVIAGCVALLFAAGCESSRQNQYMPAPNQFQSYGGTTGYQSMNTYPMGSSAPAGQNASSGSGYYSPSSSSATVVPRSGSTTGGSTQIPPYSPSGYGTP